MAVVQQCGIADQLMRGRIDGYYEFVTSWFLMCLYLFQGAYRSRTVMEFKIQIFHAWKVMVKQPNGCHIFDQCACFPAFI